MTLLTNLLQAKYDLTQSLIQKLPENLQSPVKRVQHEVLISFREAIEVILEKSNEEAKKADGTKAKAKELNTINID